MQFVNKHSLMQKISLNFKILLKILISVNVNHKGYSCFNKTLAIFTGNNLYDCHLNV